MSAAEYLVPGLFFALLCYAVIRRVSVYRAVTEGAGKAIPLAVSLFPYLTAVFFVTNLLSVCGAMQKLGDLLSPLLSLLGIPEELAALMIVKPFSGSGSLAALSEILSVYGADSAVGRTAAVVYGSSETTFYVAAIYFAGSKKRRLFAPVFISLTVGIFAAAFGSLLIRLGL